MSQSLQNPRLLDIVVGRPVIPVLTIESAEQAVPLASALADGGLTIIEVTLRTPAGLASVAAIREQCRHVVVGAGTILTPEDGQRAIESGAQFIVSPGITPRLIQAAEGWDVPFLPGAATASEAMALSDIGYRFQKLFPAEASGGVGALKSLQAPLPDIAFCPTGGVGPQNVEDYLALPNVRCVGGSWVAPSAAVARGDWATITGLARQASELAGIK